MALLGVFVSFTLAMGILWISRPYLHRRLSEGQMNRLTQRATMLPALLLAPFMLCGCNSGVRPYSITTRKP